ncbi:MAG: HEAT repeat domain-containing protein [Pirellulales bacterium]
MSWIAHQWPAWQSTGCLWAGLFVLLSSTAWEASFLSAAPPSEPPQPVAAPSDSDAAETEQMNLVLELVAGEADDALRLDLLNGLRTGLEGRRRVTMPPGWPAVYQKLHEHNQPELRQVVQELALVFGQPEAIAALVETARDGKRELDLREGAIETLAQAQEPAGLTALLDLLDDPAVRILAAKSLAAYTDDRIAPRMLAVYAKWPAADRHHLVQTLSARPTTALALLDAMGAGQVDRQAITAFTARQLSALGEPVERRLREVWGEVRPASADKSELMEKYRGQLNRETLAKADVSRGRAIFQRTCQKCHKLFGEGETVGPDLTGTNRISLDYLLENVLDPNALVGKDYQLTIFTLVDGRVISGLVQFEDGETLRVRTPNETVVLALSDVESRDRSLASMMPEGQLNDLTADEVAQLIAYLQYPKQVPLPAAP